MCLPQPFTMRRGGAPSGIRIRVKRLKVSHPRPLDDGDLEAHLFCLCRAMSSSLTTLKFLNVRSVFKNFFNLLLLTNRGSYLKESCRSHSNIFPNFINLHASEWRELNPRLDFGRVSCYLYTTFAFLVSKISKTKRDLGENRTPVTSSGGVAVVH